MPANLRRFAQDVVLLRNSAPIDVGVNSLEFVDFQASGSASMTAASLPAAEVNADDTWRRPCIARTGRCQCGECQKRTIATVLGGVRLRADDSYALFGELAGTSSRQ